MELSFLSDEQVQKCASFSVNERFDLYDERFGSIKSTSKCTTCNKTETTGCYGHYGSLYIGTELFHPMFHAEISIAINGLCQHCTTPHDKVGGNKGGIKCEICNKTTFTDYNIFPSQSHIMRRRYGVQTLTPTKCKNILQNHPCKVYIISHIIVPPTGVRPPEDVEWPSEISRAYSKLVETIQSPTTGPKHYKRVNQLYNSIVGYTRKDGVIKALSGKRGIFRTLMLGKRLNRSARLVIVGDPNLDVDEILVPHKIAMGVRISERVWSGNVDLMKSYASKSQLWWHSEDTPALPDHVIIGKVYDRALVNRDLVMLNRQPSLSKFSLLAFRVRTNKNIEQDTFAFNPAVTPAFNADFDGDEMNIYAGYGLEAKAELMEFCHVSKNIYDPLTMHVLIHPIQDVISAVYMMSKDKQLVSRDVYLNCYTKLNCRHPIKTQPPNTLDVLSLAIPSGITFRDQGVVIEDGTLESGTITKNILCQDLIIHIAKHKGTQILAEFIRNIQWVALMWLDAYGFTLGIQDCIWDKSHGLQYQTNVENIKNADDVADLQDQVLHQTIHQYHTEQSTNPLSIMIRSGAKGKDIGAAQMAISIGQQYIGNTKPTIKRGQAPNENGFIASSYAQGMNPREYFFQASASLSGIIDIGTSVSAIGYANRRVSKLTADVALGYNGVIGTPKQVVQFAPMDL